MATELTDAASRMSTSPTNADGEWYCSHASFDKWCLACAHKEIDRLRHNTASDLQYMRKLERDLRWAERRIEEGGL